MVLNWEPAGPLSIWPIEKTQIIPKVQQQKVTTCTTKKSTGTKMMRRLLPMKSEAASRTAREICSDFHMQKMEIMKRKATAHTPKAEYLRIRLVWFPDLRKS